ncbi:MAG: hypothetical protein BGN89_19955 [Alphaproteobacteria bacterium 64-6]|nr:MAG: hypothetical protein BGN89_19955 [Alphaproteobacteria bacterium 64-6]
MTWRASRLIEVAMRQASGYRDYSDKDVHTLRFIRKACDLGFCVEQMNVLLALWRDRRSSAEVKAIALQHGRDLQGKVRMIEEMIATLSDLAQHCYGDDRPDCPIIAEPADAYAKPAPSNAPVRRA